MDPFSALSDSLRARLYAALHCGTEGDLGFYLRSCQGAQRIVEFGSGAGRISLALAAQGVSVTGVELDSALLALAIDRQRELEVQLGRALPCTFLAGDMTQFSGPAVYDRVLIPYSALWCLPGDAAKSRCLRNAHGCLVPGGELVLDVYDADVFAPDDEDEVEGADDNGESDEFEILQRLSVDGEDYQVWERNAWDAGQRVMHVEYRLSPVDSKGSRRADSTPLGWPLSVNHSVIWRHELAELLEQCGFDVEWGVDEEGEATEFADQVVVRARKD